MSTLGRLGRLLLWRLRVARSGARAGRSASRRSAPSFLVFQDIFTEEQLAFGPGQLADPNGPQVILVLSTDALTAGLRAVH